MSRFVLLIALSLLPLTWAGHAGAQTLAPTTACEAAIARAERAEALPLGLLEAIGRVESGRVDPVDAVIRPWPWTINVNGMGRMFDTKDATIEAVRALQAEGVRSIDVGCLQVNLLYHPNAFRSLEQAFDPGANAAYAARFLRTLFDESQDWTTAAAAYHSRTPDLGASYRRLVLAAWKPTATPPASWASIAQATTRPLPHPFAPPALSVGFEAQAASGSEAAARLLALTPDCVEAAPPAPSQWMVRARSPACGRSPFSTASLLRYTLASGTPPPQSDRHKTRKSD
jgi:hypothetical protein